MRKTVQNRRLVGVTSHMSGSSITDRTRINVFFFGPLFKS
jgi:hypothetical protein